METNAENNQQSLDQSEVPQNQDGAKIPLNSPLGQGRPKGSCLDLLPSDIKDEFDQLIASKLGAKKIKPFLQEKFKGRSKLLDASLSTYQGYINQHKEAILRRVELNKAVLSACKENATDIKQAVDITLSASPIETRRKALSDLYVKVQNRVDLIAQQQTAGPLDPRLEGVYATYMRELRVLLKEFEGIQEEVKKDDMEKFIEWTRGYTYCLLTLMKQTYEQIHGKEKLNEFYEELGKKYGQALDKFLADGGKWTYGPTMPNMEIGENK
jgi:hypothetical protein